MDVITKQLWMGKIPVEFSLCMSDNACATLPSNQFGLYSRFSYLPAAGASIVEYFRLSAVDMLSDVWFESNGIPLRVNLPIGVLYDLMHRRSTTIPIVPWKIVVHFTGFPGEKVIKCPNEISSARLFAHSLKQALFLLYGSTRPYNTLPLDSQESLWLAAKWGQLSRFDHLVEMLMPNIESIRTIPVRIVFSTQSVTLQRPFFSHLADGTVTSFSIVRKTVNDYIKSMMPAVISGETQDLTSHVSITTPENTAPLECQSRIARMAAEPETIIAASVDYSVSNAASISSESEKSVTLTIHGIVIPDKAKLFDVWSVFCHADLFLYVVVQ